MKKSLQVLIALILAVALAGCGLFSSEKSDKGGEKAESVTLVGGRVYTFPKDVDFDTFYLAQIDVNPDDENSLLSEFLDFGIQKEYHITYAKDAKAVYMDDVYLCDTAENAKGMYDYLIEMGADETGLRVYGDDPTMLVYSYNQKMVEGMILQFAGYGIGLEADADAATYAQFDADMYGGYLINANAEE